MFSQKIKVEYLLAAGHFRHGFAQRFHVVGCGNPTIRPAIVVVVDYNARCFGLRVTTDAANVHIKHFALNVALLVLVPEKHRFAVKSIKSFVQSFRRGVLLNP